MESPPLDSKSADWIRDAIGQSAEELRLFLATLWQVAAHPNRFARDWVRGTRTALNPLAFMAMSLAAYTTFASVADFALRRGQAEPRSLVAMLLTAIGPYAYYILLAMVAHLVLKMLGTTGRWQDTLAMTLFVGGGPATLLVQAVGILLAFVAGTNVDANAQPRLSLFVMSIALGVWVATMGYLCSALAGAHSVPSRRGWRVVVALGCAIGLAGLSFGHFAPSGHFGPRLTFALRQENGRTVWWYGVKVE